MIAAQTLDADTLKTVDILFVIGEQLLCCTPYTLCPIITFIICSSQEDVLHHVMTARTNEKIKNTCASTPQDTYMTATVIYRVGLYFVRRGVPRGHLRFFETTNTVREEKSPGTRSP